MGKSSQYNHFMKRIDITGQNAINIEDYFSGLLYEKAVGMNNIGKAKNIYTEEYADSDRKRYYLPEDDNYANESTTITMHFLVVGDASERQTTINRFLQYVRTGVHTYWDDARNREFDFIVTGEIKVSDEKWHGSRPYIEIEVPLLNLNGRTRLRTDVTEPIVSNMEPVQQSQQTVSDR